MKTSRIAWLLVALCAGFALTAAADDPPAGAGPDELFGKLDKNADGKLTDDEVGEEQARFFERLVRVGDKDSDKVLTKDEFLEALKNDDDPVPGGFGPAGGGREGRPRMDPKQMFERFDSNKDGKLSLEEMPEPMRERVQPLLDRLGKTELTAEDLERLHRMRERPEGKAGNKAGKKGGGKKRFGGPDAGAGDGPRRSGPPRPPRFFEKLDANGDHRLSKDELSKMADLFGEFDEDGDGQLDPHELLGPPPHGDGPGGFGPGRFRPERPGPPNRPEKPDGDGPPRDENTAARSQRHLGATT